ncbi:MAG TPA: GIY-YIG nuclease family protein [Rhizomicrobium sp.]
MPSTARQISVYVLRCSDDSYYVGLTRAGLDKRIGEHTSGVFSGYTYWRRPVELVWSQEFQRLTDAISCEQQLKGWRREKKEAISRADYDALIEFAGAAKIQVPRAIKSSSC